MPFRYDPLPDTRQEFQKNQLPITRDDIRYLAENHGEEIAENARLCAQEIRRRGGINPRSIELPYPNGTEGDICIEGLKTLINNLQTWWEYDD